MHRLRSGKTTSSVYYETTHMILPLMLVFHCPCHSFTVGSIFRGHADAGQSGECLWHRIVVHSEQYVKFWHRNSSSKPSTTAHFKPLPFTCDISGLSAQIALAHCCGVITIISHYHYHCQLRGISHIMPPYHRLSYIIDGTDSSKLTVVEQRLICCTEPW